jgi:uncharacterized protein
MSGFILNLATLPAGTSRVEARAGAAELDLPVADWPEPVQAELQVEKTGELITVRGPVRATARLECVRCLRSFDDPLEFDLQVVADRAGHARGLEAELERDDYMMFHDGRQIDLRQNVREGLLLELPITPHCREACRGLCPRCGADLNEGPCGCAARE